MTVWITDDKKPRLWDHSGMAKRKAKTKKGIKTTEWAIGQALTFPEKQTKPDNFQNRYEPLRTESRLRLKRTARDPLKILRKRSMRQSICQSGVFYSLNIRANTLLDIFCLMMVPLAAKFTRFCSSILVLQSKIVAVSIWAIPPNWIYFCNIPAVDEDSPATFVEKSVPE